MGVQKKEASRPKKVPGNLKLKGENFYRDRKKVQYINMLKGGRAKHDSKGNLVKAAPFQSTEATPARIEPNRKWFGNTRVIGQKALDEFREQMSTKINDPYQVLLRRSKLPTSLLHDNTHIGRVNMLQTETFGDTFGPKAQRKRPKLNVEGYDQLVSKITDSEGTYDHKKDANLLANQQSDFTDAARDWYFSAGTSKRIWNELYKVVDSSDVILHVLDARDPEGTRCRHVENYIKTEAPHKNLIYILNKVDLVPTWVTARWVKVLSREHPTLAFHASISRSFGKGSLIQLLRQFTRLHSDKRQISVGLIGYPNTGKSSIINTLRQKKVCNVAPMPGETKVWQYITMTRRIYLIDCPGIVQFSSSDTDTDIVLKGSIRTQSLLSPEDYIPEILSRVRKEYIQRQYQIDKWDDAHDFLSELATITGKLNKGGEPNLHVISKMVINDWQRGRLPHYRAPPEFSEPLPKQASSEQTDAATEKATVGADAEDETMEGASDNEEVESKRITLAELNINQIFSKIPVVAEYLPVDLEGDKDLKALEKIQGEEAAQKSSKKAAGKRKREAEVADTSDVEADWDEVFESAVKQDVGSDSELDTDLSSAEGEDAESDSAEASESDEEDASDNDEEASDNDEEASESGDEEVSEEDVSEAESEEDVKPKKSQRMTTNKQKVGKNFYQTTNVKNRSRKTRPLAPGAMVKRMRMPGLWAVSSKSKRR
ncbi:GTPase required for pre-60S ribosomal subunit nuclear export and maturation [Coemansia sp. RSA 2523]|nr:GTPase required for pre-60S ribosomal subunit nuclear export and maturation [Coemansia sp. RSA 1824]KAJ1810316.1 GTPase required for pre-60S ribosomal subunit nuclear export and maturation [Coemansia sp. RSA 2523]KAJ2255907.1 GTPase required for pre-60S ribosomal subunit nuclear export and maturation [Coemansia sp. RSA 454]KAJ2271553.1 GTPase required for pre-60S ribosomal subunit nuclear export and maturation [Coemansia sp. RSA 451]KAJ2407303.1 GTPase required for pre-60S ribosomal subunit 